MSEAERKLRYFAVIIQQKAHDQACIEVDNKEAIVQVRHPLKVKQALAYVVGPVSSMKLKE